MATLQIRTKRAGAPPSTTITNTLPSLLHTPSGLAILELQGTINLPNFLEEDTASTDGSKLRETPVGRLVFPDYEEGAQDAAWMKRVYLYVGKHQRLTGEVKKLPKAVAVIRKVKEAGSEEGEEGEMLEVVEIVQYKILFSTRPEPVGTSASGE